MVEKKGDFVKRNVLVVILVLVLLLSVWPQNVNAASGSSESTKGSLTPAQTNASAPRSYFPKDVTQIKSNASLPDPFEFFNSGLGTNGRVVSKEDWQARRQEIKDLAQYYYFGYKQPTAQSASKLVKRITQVPASTTIKSSVIQPGTFTVNLPQGSYYWDYTDFTLHPVLSFKNSQWGSWDDHKDLLVTTPAHQRTDYVVTVAAGGKNTEFKIDELDVPVYGTDTQIKGPYPVVIVIGMLSSEQVKTLMQNGYAYIAMNTGSVYSDDSKATGAYTALYPKTKGVYEYDSGALMGWAWGVSRIIDALQNDTASDIDGTRTVVTGVSRNGKAALIAAAFDERISIAVPCESGATGLSNFRYTDEGQLLQYNTYGANNTVNRVYTRNEKPINTIGGSGHWLSSKAQDFVPDKVDNLPFDMNEVAALIAPRPLIAFTGENYEWLGSVSTAVTMAAVQDVYDFLGAGDNVTLIVRDAAHASQDRDLPFIIAAMDKTFGRSDKLTVQGFKSLSSANSIAALDGSGAIYPTKTYPTISAMNAVPYEIDSFYQHWSRPGKYKLWSETELITEGFANNITVHSNAPQVSLTLPDGTILKQDVTDGTAVLALTAQQAQVGRYKLDTVGKDMDNKTVYFQCYDLANALRHGLGLTSGSPDGMNIGFSSKLVNSKALVVSMTANGMGRQLETGSVDGKTPIYLETYGVSLKQKYIPAGPFTLMLKNLTLEALPGCTFELTVDLVGVRSGGNMTAQSKQGEKPTWNSTNLKIGPMPQWPIYPENVRDTGARPDAVPTVSAFKTNITLGAYDGQSVTLNFSEPVNTREFGIGFSKVTKWTTVWAKDAKSVTISFDKRPESDVTLYLFRLTDMKNNMIPAPKVLTLKTPGK